MGISDRLYSVNFGNGDWRRRNVAFSNADCKVWWWRICLGVFSDQYYYCNPGRLGRSWKKKKEKLSEHLSH